MTKRISPVRGAMLAGTAVRSSIRDGRRPSVCATANAEAVDKAGASAPYQWASFWKGPCFCASGRGARAGDEVVVGVCACACACLRACVRACVYVCVCVSCGGGTDCPPTRQDTGNARAWLDVVGEVR